MKARLVAAALALAIAAISAPSVAQSGEAARAFDEGARLFQQAEYRKAARKFMRAFKLAPHGDAAYNAALSWERAGEKIRAAEAFEQAIGRDLRDEARTDATERLRQLRQTLGIVSVTATEGAEVRVDGRSREAPAEFYVKAGKYVVTLLDDGKRRQRAVSVSPGREVVVTFADEDEEDEEEEEQPRARPRRPPEEDSSVWPVVGWSGVVGGVLLSGAAVYVGLQARDERQEFNASDRTDLEMRDRALRLQTWTAITWVSAGVVGGAGVVILLVDGETSDVSAGATPGGAFVRGRF